jgi:hypothetical protein
MGARYCSLPIMESHVSLIVQAKENPGSKCLVTSPCSPDLPAPRLAAGVPGEELPCRPEGVGGQLLGPVGHAGGG